MQPSCTIERKFFEMIFITNNKSSKVLEPCKQTLNLPTLSVSPQYSAVLAVRFTTIIFMWRDHLNTTLFFQNLIKLVTVYTPTHCQDKKPVVLRWTHRHVLPPLERRDPRRATGVPTATVRPKASVRPIDLTSVNKIT